MDAIEYLENLGKELQGIGLDLNDDNREAKLRYAQERLLEGARVAWELSASSTPNSATPETK